MSKWVAMLQYQAIPEFKTTATEMYCIQENEDKSM